MKYFTLIVAAILSFTTPTFAKDNAALCTSALSHAANINTKQPIEADAATNTTAARASCEARNLIVTRQIDLKHARMESDFKTFLTKQITDHACANQAEGQLVRSGWTVRYENVFRDGPVVKINVACKKLLDDLP